MNILLNEIKRIYESIDEASVVNIKDFHYVMMQEQLKEKLKELLKGYFGDEITFDRDETFAYIQAHFRGVGIEINIYNGIILTIEDGRFEKLITDFEPIFSLINEPGQLCSYRYCSNLGDENTSYPTAEWNLHPDDRLYELVHGWNVPPGETIKGLTDYYTTSVIEELGDNLLTDEGFNRIFERASYDSTFQFYKMRQIEKARPDIDSNALHNWIYHTKFKLLLERK